MRVVLDASAAFAVASAGAPSVLDDADAVYVPDLFVPEVTNAVWKQHQFGGIEFARCESVLDQLLKLPDTIVPSTTLCREALLLARTTRHSVYDLFYLVLARREGAVLFTKDKALRKLAQGQGVDVA